MPTFTPGPWEPYMPGRKFVVPKRNFNAVCELNEFERDAETVDANARLIAAAPDMLAVLIAVRDYARDSRTGRMLTGEGYAAIDAAIAKATA